MRERERERRADAEKELAQAQEKGMMYTSISLKFHKECHVLQ